MSREKRLSAPLVAPGGSSHNPPSAQPPAILECPKCRQRVIVHVPAAATCLPCGRRMGPIGPKPEKA